MMMTMFEWYEPDWQTRIYTRMVNSK